MSEEGHDRGQALPLLLIVLGVTLVALLVVARLATAADDAARARTAADAAALAGAAEGRVVAASVASANGGVLLDYDWVRRPDGIAVEVVVEVGVARARARAEEVVEWVPTAMSE